MPDTLRVDFDQRALTQAMLRHLCSSLGKDRARATTYDWRMALALSLRDLVVEPWFAATRRTYEAKGKRVFYLSMEFLIGRLIEDVAINLGAEEMAACFLDSLSTLGNGPMAMASAIRSCNMKRMKADPVLP